MRLTRAGEYAVRCMLYLSTREQGQVVRRQVVAEEMEIPNQFLGKIAQQLARAGFIEIVQGASGGYRQLTPPQRLTLLEVVEAVTGEIVLNDCVLMPGSCFRSPSCSVHRAWFQARDQLRETLRQATFDRLLGEDFCFVSRKSAGIRSKTAAQDKARIPSGKRGGDKTRERNKGP